MDILKNLEWYLVRRNQSKLDLSSILDSKRVKQTDGIYYIDIIVEGTSPHQLQISNDNLVIIKKNKNNEWVDINGYIHKKCNPDIIWRPESKLRDYIVYPPLPKDDSGNNIIMNIGCGIGSIVVETINTYIVLMFIDKDIKMSPVMYSAWHKNKKDKMIISQDINFGLEVLYIFNKTKYYILNEK